MLRGDLDAVAVRSDPRRGCALADLRAIAAGHGGQRGDAAVGVEQRGVGLVEADGLRRQVELREALGDRLAVERFEWHAHGRQRRAQRREPRLAGRTELEAAGREQQTLAGLRLQRAPERQRGPRQLDILRLRVGQPEDPRAAVRAAALVPERELLEQQDAPAVSGQVVGRRAAHHTGADHDRVVGVGVQVAHSLVSNADGRKCTPIISIRPRSSALVRVR